MILDGYILCFSYTNSTPYVIWFQGFYFPVFYMGQEMPLKFSIGILYNTAETMLNWVSSQRKYIHAWL